MTLEQCGLCDYPLQKIFSDSRNFFSYDCWRCGSVKITEDAVLLLKGHPEIERPKLSGFCRERHELKKLPVEILTNNLKSLIAGTPNSISQKENKILEHIKRNTDYFGKNVVLEWMRDFPIAYAVNKDEFKFLIEHISNTGYIDGNGDGKEFQAHLTVDGLNYIDSIKSQFLDTNQVFVAMWFDESLDNIYQKGFSRAISDCGFHPIRIDLIHHNDKIDDRIIVEIKRSKFLIADFTGNRGGVYFEAGLAIGLEIPVIWSCKEDEIQKVHFDTRQFNHIVWKDKEDLYSKLCDRIRATIL